MAEPVPGERPPAASPKEPLWTKASVQFLVAFFALWLAFGWVATQLSTLPDTDSYFHLTVARLFAHEGVVDTLPWLRYSLLQGVEGVGFGDKEFLFHLLLAPFAREEFGTTGGRWALAFWNALAFVTLAAVGRSAAGRWGLLVPFVLWFGSLDFLGRLVRLRPETPALILFVLAAVCAGQRRYRLLALVTAAFTLTYTAFHALLGLCVLWFLWQAWQDRRAGRAWLGLPWQGLAYPVLGCGLGLLLHPHFPQNLVLWKTQTFDFFRYKDQLDVGTEIGAQSTDALLLQNLPWLLACVVLALAALSGRRGASVASGGTSGRALRGIADTMTLAAACFGVLYLLMMRFSTHALPLLTLALLFRLAARGRRPGPWLSLPGGVRVPTALALLPVLLVGAWRASTLVGGMIHTPDREREWAALGAALPDGARVAAPWGQTPQYFFWAPTAKFLNDLDPVFMAVPYPEQYWLQRSLFDGTEPDVPMALAAGLDSEYLAVSRFLLAPRLAARLTGDPRVERVYDDWNLVFRMTPLPDDEHDDFLVDWHLVPQGTGLPVSADADLGAWPVYPRVDDPALRRLEAYVDGRRVPRPGRCFAVSRDVEDPGSRYELAAAGPTTLWISGDSTQTVQLLDSPGAVLGRGVVFSVDARAGDPSSDGTLRFTVVSCLAVPEEAETPPQIGFYLRRLDAKDAS